MATLTSAEAVTKLLRARNATPESVVPVALDLLLGNISVYLPNASQFVFELICDRMNDLVGKAFKQWNYCPELWTLWEQCWKELGKTSINKEVRSKSFANVKLLPVVLDILEKVYEDCTTKIDIKQDEKQKNKNQKKKNKDTNEPPLQDDHVKYTLSPKGRHLISSMFQSLRTFMESGYILVDEFSAMGLLKSYTLLLSLEFETDSESESWTRVVSDLNSIPRQSIAYKPSSKAITKYYNEVLPLTLPLLSERTVDHLDLSYLFCHKVFCQILFEGDTPSIINHAKSQGDFTKSLSDSNCEYLFEQSIQHLAPSDVTQCEILYTALTRDKPGNLCTSLLGSLSKLNRVLSPQFCQDIYEKEVRSKDINYMLIAQLLSIDTSLVLQRWKETIDLAHKVTDFSLMAPSIALGFVRAREYPKFLNDVYPYVLKMSHAWDTKEVSESLAVYIDELSGNQIETVVKEHISKKQLKPLLLVVQGLLSCSLQKQEAAKLTLVDSKLQDFASPELFYYVYCLYGGEALVQGLFHEPSNKKLGSYFDLCLALRNAELNGSVKDLKTKDLTKIIVKLSTSEILLLLKRWLVLIDRVPAVHIAVLDRFFLLPKEILSDYLKVQGPMIFELPTFLKSMLTYIEENQVAKIEELLLFFPTVVLRKFFAEFVGKLCKKLKKNSVDLPTLHLMSYILQSQNLSLEVETDADFIVNLMRNGNSESIPIVCEIAKNVWNSHLNKMKSPDSKEFVSKLSSQIISYLKKPKTGDMELAQCLLSQKKTNSIQNAEELIELYVKVIANNVKSYSLEKQIDLLAGISLVSFSAKHVVKQILKSLGSQSISNSSKTKLYDVVIMSSDGSQAAYVCGLFVAIVEQIPALYHDQLSESLSKYISTLTEEEFVKIYEQTIRSFKDIPEEFLYSLLHVLVILMSLKKRDAVTNSEVLLTSSLTTVATHLKECQDLETLLRVLNCISASLTYNAKSYRQYSVELVMEICTSALSSYRGLELEQVYESVTSIFNSVLLFHRYRLSGRYHIVINLMTKLLEMLSQNRPLCTSRCAASAFLRLLVTLCSPQIYGSNKDNNSLTSQAALYKTAFRKHSHILLLNFISIHLLNPFSGKVYDEVMIGVQSLFELMTSEEIKLARKYLDSVGQTYFQTLYSHLKANSHWNQQT